MKKHKISWLNIPGYIPTTWNPVVGCNKVSPGCANCYAEKWAARLASMPAQKHKYGKVITDGKWNGCTFADPYTIDAPSGWRKPHSIFVCSMGDLFHETISFSLIDEIWDEMCFNPQHLYIVLTKRPERMLEYFKHLGKRVKEMGFDSVPTQSNNLLNYMSCPDFIWMGVTAENQEQADIRIPILLQSPATVRFVSCEPLLGEISLLQYLPIIVGNKKYNRYSQIDWVIAGGESGPGYRKMIYAWPFMLKSQCKAAGIPYFFKQWHKKSDGRLLVGQEYNEFPQLTNNQITKR